MANTTIKQRQIAGGLDGWIPAEQTWAYASASTITVPSGAASKYQKGDKIKWTQGTVKYGFITGVADTVLTIAVNTDYVVTNEAISSPCYSRVESPFGYPASFTTTSGESIYVNGGIVTRIKAVDVVAGGSAGGEATTWTFGTAFTTILSVSTSGGMRTNASNQVGAKTMALADIIGASSARIVVQTGDGSNLTAATHRVFCTAIGKI